MERQINPVGAHVSAAGGLWNAPINAAKQGLDCFQFFSRSPQGGRVAAISQFEAERFRQACAEAGIRDWFIHAPFIVNLASAEKRIRDNSIVIIRTELERAEILGAKAMMTHLGSATGVGETEGLRLAIEGVRRIADGFAGQTQFLLEISAGAGQVIGDNFQEMAAILEGVGDPRLGVCFDTAHAFASGYDLRTETAVAKTMAEFDAAIGLDRLVLVHCNDSKIPLGSRKDRHEHLGLGMIGAEGFRALLKSPALAGKPFILETPDDEQRAADVDRLKEWRAI